MENHSPYRTWAPAESCVRIEYATGVLGRLRQESVSGDTAGVLFGVRHGDELRVLAARSQTDTASADLAGLEPVGIFAARVRGEVFLTESDLERFLTTDGFVALVIAGAKGGFFVRESDGSIQTIRSYQEFPLADNTPGGRRPQSWMLVAPLALAALFFIARADLQEVFFRPAEALTVRRDAGQLLIAWNPAAVRKRDKLEILEGAEETTIPIAAPLVNATYMPRTDDGEVRVFLLDEHGLPGRETALFVSNPPTPSPEIERIRAEIESLEAEATGLRATFESRRARAVELQRTLSQSLRPR